LTATAGTAANTTPAPTLPKLKTAKTIRVGFFGNVTHGSALIAQEKKFFEKYLKGTTIEYVAFNADPAVIEAMKGGSIDVSFIGPNPAVAGYVSTRGSLLRIVGGSTTGGAQFITKQNITTVADLKGKTFATPQLGNTQDVALRSYLKSKGYTTSILGGDVNIAPTANASTLDLFKNGTIDGAWVPEPWASRLVLEANGRVFLDE
jgi:NitT/TauT family transport system substrate-binding protein